MITRDIIMGGVRRYVVKDNNVNMLLSINESRVFEGLETISEKTNFVKSLVESKLKNFRVSFKVGDEMHKRVIKAVDEKDAISAVHDMGGTVLGVEIVSDGETKGKPKSVIGEMIETKLEKFKNFKGNK